MHYWNLALCCIHFEGHKCDLKSRCRLQNSWQTRPLRYAHVSEGEWILLGSVGFLRWSKYAANAAVGRFGAGGPIFPAFCPTGAATSSKPSQTASLGESSGTFSGSFSTIVGLRLRFGRVGTMRFSWLRPWRMSKIWRVSFTPTSDLHGGKHSGMHFKWVWAYSLAPWYTKISANI